MKLKLGILIFIFCNCFNTNVINAEIPNKGDNNPLFGIFHYSGYIDTDESNFLNDSMYKKVSLVNKETHDDSTFLDESSTDNVGNFNNMDLLKKEIQTLNKELDKLNKHLSKLEDENQQLKLSLEKINVHEQTKAKLEALANNLQKEAREYRANHMDPNIPDQYAMAQDLIIVGDIDLAKKQLEDFLVKNSANALNGVNNTNQQNINKIYIAYSNYWLGKIYIIENNYYKAVQYLAECYKVSNSTELSLKSLVALIDGLTNLAHPVDACNAIHQFNKVYQQASQNKDFSFPEYYLKLIEDYKSINRCQ